MSMIRFFICFVLSIFSFTLISHAQEKFKYEAKLKELAAPYIENKVFQSAMVGVVLDGKSWFLPLGKLSASNESAPNQDTLYEIGSITKVFTATLLADAVENQKSMKLDQTIADVLPELARLNQEVASKVTLKHLAQHMSGLPRMPDNIMPKDPNNPFADYDRKLLHEYFSTAKLSQEPGIKNDYSNLGVGLLGDILSANANTSYEQLLKDRILKPLSMSSTLVSVDAVAKQKLAPPTNSALVQDHAWDFDALAGAGAIRSSAGDMVKFLQANLNPPNNEIGKALELAQDISLPASDEHAAMGLCWMIAADGSTHWHNGQTGGYHSMVLFNRPFKAGLVFLCNTATMDVDQLAENMFQTLLGMDVEPRKFDKEVVVDKAILERLVGKYVLAPGVEFTVTSNGDRLLVQLTGQQALRVYPESDTIWNYREVVAQLRFDLPKEGPATKVTLYQNGQVLPASRKK